MNAGFMREGIGADDGFVRLHRETGHARHQTTDGHDMRRVDTRVAAKEILPRAHRHDDLFQRGVAGTFA